MLLFKQKTAYEMRMSDWSSDVCSSDRVESARPQGPVPIAPAGGRMGMVEMGGRAEEAFAPGLALIGALGQSGMGLARRLAFDARKRDPVAHGRARKSVV